MTTEEDNLLTGLRQTVVGVERVFATLEMYRLRAEQAESESLRWKDACIAANQRIHDLELRLSKALEGARAPHPPTSN